jgi:hypothetical protein
MPLSLSYATPSTGAIAEYHVVTSINLDLENSKTTASVTSFVNKAARIGSKSAMFQQQIQIDGLPADGQIVKDFAEAALVVVPPAGTPPVPFPNQFDFAGAEIVD